MQVGTQGGRDEGSRRDLGLGRRLAILLVRIYQLLVAPWLGPACRFEPSCSRYAMVAIERHGVMRGATIALHRLGRCHPLGGSGYDPVP